MPAIKKTGILNALLAVAFLSVGLMVGCGDQLPAGTSTIIAKPTGFEYTVAGTGPRRSTKWVTFTTLKTVKDPYDNNGSFNEDTETLNTEGSEITDPIRPVPHVAIVFDVTWSNAGFDTFFVRDADGNAQPAVILLDSGGREVASPFVTETDDNGNYVLGMSFSTDANYAPYSGTLEARSGSLVRTVEYTVDVENN